ncbi:NUDIX hydrolase [Actinopolymorpha singaporensis]|uniref:ADP-ribose pyrophosphatase YjhB, NUDIX family n=1 Tax=Actinopolymorpha singaporensis TaxID=117157 RepID=A0A1H1QMV6_9ACTN|nr:NUDIX hydrolase [Actinopolymorpha singaporensis]SDS24716.1 ADP-ribose pyrophosphatase YjhB, NUDIX family [Actinopolymorpha singaporensis]
MDVIPAGPADRFPLLFAPQRWEWAGLDAQFSTTLPPEPLVQSIHVVGFVGDEVAVCRDHRDVWFLPGGTREPGESVLAAVDREIAEEAGARRVGPLRWFGAHHCVSDRPAPYRPHLPHPNKAWLWCFTDVVVDGVPSNPPGGEQVEEVRVVPVAQARELLRTDGDWYPELLDLAGEIRRAEVAGDLTGGGQPA